MGLFDNNFWSNALITSISGPFGSAYNAFKAFTGPSIADTAKKHKTILEEQKKRGTQTSNDAFSIIKDQLHKSIDNIRYAYGEREKLKGQLVEKGNEAYNSLKSSYNNKGFDSLILSGLDTNFDNELSEIEKEYQSKYGRKPTYDEVFNWINGDKVFGKNLRESETEIRPGIYLWHGRAFVGDKRTPITSEIKRTNEQGDIETIDSNGVIRIDKSSKNTSFLDYIVQGLSTPEGTVVDRTETDGDGHYTKQSILNAASKRNEGEWTAFLKKKIQEDKQLVDFKETGALYKFFKEDNLNDGTKKIYDDFLKKDKYWKSEDAKGNIYYSNKDLYLLLLDRVRSTYNSNTFLDAFSDIQKDALFKQKIDKVITEEEYKKNLDQLETNINSLKESFPNDAALGDFLSIGNDYIGKEGKALKETIQSTLMTEQTKYLNQARKAIVRSLNNSKFADWEWTDKQTKANKQDDEVLHVKHDFSSFVAGLDLSGATDYLNSIDAQLEEAKTSIAKAGLEEVLKDKNAYRQAVARGKYAALSTPGFDADSDDILHSVLISHGAGEDLSSYDMLTEDQTNLAYAYLAMDQDALSTMYGSNLELQQQQFQRDMQRYDYDAQGWFDKAGMAAYRWITTPVGLAAQIAGFVGTGVADTFFSIADAIGADNLWSGFSTNNNSIGDYFRNTWNDVLNNSLVQWGTNLQSTGYWRNQDYANKGRAFTDAEIKEFEKAGLFQKYKTRVAKDKNGNIKKDANGNPELEYYLDTDEEALEALKSGSTRVAGGNTFGIYKALSLSDAASGGGSLADSTINFFGDAIAVATQMVATGGTSAIMREIGGLMAKLGSWINKVPKAAWKNLGNLENLSMGSKAWNAVKLIPGTLGYPTKWLGVSTQALSPHLASLGLDFGYAVSSYKEHIQDARSKVFSNDLDELLEAPSKSMQYLIDDLEKTDPKQIYGGMNEAQFEAYLDNKIIEETNRLAEETEYGLRGHQFLKNLNKDEDGNYNYNEENIDTAKIKEYVTKKLKQNKKYVYMMDQYMKHANDIALKSTALEFGMVSLADGVMIQTFKPAFLWTQSIQYAQEGVKSGVKRLWTKTINKGINTVNKVAKTKINNITYKPLSASERALNKVKIDTKTNKVLEIEKSTEDSASSIRKQMLKSSFWGFLSNYLQDVSTHFDKGFYNSLMSQYVVNTYSPSSALTFLGPLTDFAENEWAAGLEGAGEGLVDRQSIYDGILGAIGGLITPQVTAGKPKYTPTKDTKLTAGQRLANFFHSYITHPNISWIPMSYYKATHGKSNNYIRAIQARNDLKMEYAKNIELLLKERGLGVLSNLAEFKNELARMYELKFKESQGENQVDDFGTTRENPGYNSIKARQMLAETLTELMSATFVDENGVRIRNSDNPAYKIYRQYIKDLGKRSKVTADYITRIWKTFLQESANASDQTPDFTKIFNSQELSILNDLQNYQEGTKKSNDEMLQQMQEDPDKLVEHVNEVTDNAKETDKVIDDYQKNLRRASYILGEQSTDPIVSRCFAKIQTEKDALSRKQDKLTKNKNSILAKLVGIKEKLIPQKELINERKLIAYTLMQYGYDPNVAKKELENIEKRITFITNSINEYQREIDAHVAKLGKKYGLKKEVSKQKVIRKLENILDQEQAKYYDALSKVKTDAEKESIEYSSEFKQAREELGKIDQWESAINNLEKTGTLNGAVKLDVNGRIIIDKNSPDLISLEELREKQREVNSIHKELSNLYTKDKKGEIAKAIKKKGVGEEETTNLENFVFTAQQTIDTLLSSKKYRNAMQTVVQAILREFISKQKDPRFRYTSKVVENQISKWQEAFGEDLQVLKDLCKNELQSRQIEQDLRTVDAELYSINRNRGNLEVLANKAKDNSKIALYKYSFAKENFGADATSYKDFIKLYNERRESLEADLNRRLEGKKDEQQNVLRADFALQLQALDEYLRDNPYFQQLEARTHQLSSPFINTAINSIIRVAEGKEQSFTPEVQKTIEGDVQQLNDSINNALKEMGIKSAQLRTVFRNLIGELIVYSEKGFPTEPDKMIEALQELQDDVSDGNAIDNVVNRVNKQLEAQNIKIQRPQIKDLIIPILLNQIKISKRAEEKANSLMLTEADKKKQKEKPVKDTEFLDSSYDAETKFVTYIAQLSSFVPNLKIVLDRLAELEASGIDDAVQILNAKVPLNSLADLYNAHSITPINLATTMSKADIENLEQALQGIINTTYENLPQKSEQEKETLGDVIENSINNLKEQLYEAEKSEEEIKNNITIQLLELIKYSVDNDLSLPVAYDTALITPKAQRENTQQKANEEGVLPPSNNPFQLSTFHRESGEKSAQMANLASTYRVEEFLRENEGNLGDREVIFLTNPAQDAILKDSIGSAAMPNASIVAVAIKVDRSRDKLPQEDANTGVIKGLITLQEGESTSEYQIIGFLPTNSTTKNSYLSRAANSAVVARKNVNQSVTRYNEGQEATSQAQEVWIPIRDYSAENSPYLTSKITSTATTKAYTRDNRANESEHSTFIQKMFKKTRSFIENTINPFSVKRYKITEKGSLRINVGTDESPIWLAIQKPSLSDVTNSRGIKFSEARREYVENKAEGANGYAKKFINFNSRTKDFADQIKVFLQRTAEIIKNPDNKIPISSAVLTAIINGKDPINPSRTINGFPPYTFTLPSNDYRVFSMSTKTLALNRNIYCTGGQLYKATIRSEGDNILVTLSVENPNGERVIGTEVEFNITDYFKESGRISDESHLDYQIAEFLSAITEPQGENATTKGETTYTEFMGSKTSFIRAGETRAEQKFNEDTRKELFDDGIYAIPDYGIFTDVQIGPIRDAREKKNYKESVEKSTRDRLNSSKVSLVDSIKNSTIQAINIIVESFTGGRKSTRVKKKAPINRATTREKQNFGASTRVIKSDNQHKQKVYDNNVLMNFILGNIVDDMAKNLAAGIDCDFSKYSTILTPNEFNTLQNMIKTGLQQFMSMNGYTLVTKRGTKESLEVVLQDEDPVFREELKNLGINPPNNYLDLLMMTPQGTLAIVDIKSHQGDTLGPEFIASYVNQLNLYAKLLNDAIHRYNERNQTDIKGVTAIHLFEVPVATRSGMNYNNIFNIETSTTEYGEEVKTFTRKTDTNIDLISADDAAHLTTYAIFSEEKLNFMIEQRRKQIIDYYKNEQQEKENEADKEAQLSTYLDSPTVLENFETQDIIVIKTNRIDDTNRFEMQILTNQGDLITTYEVEGIEGIEEIITEYKNQQYAELPIIEVEQTTVQPDDIIIEIQGENCRVVRHKKTNKPNKPEESKNPKSSGSSGGTSGTVPRRRKRLSD